MKRCLQRGLRGLYREPEGWLALPTGYDDGGVSGATLERPALEVDPILWTGFRHS